jgi:O-antigen/teichoic acid export membrane protein
MAQASALDRIIGDPVRINQAFLVCRHAGVLLGSVVVARMLPPDAVGGLEQLMLCGYLLTFFWTEALLKGFLALGAQADSPGFRSSFLWLIMLASLGMMGVLVLGSPLLLPALAGTRTLEGLGLFALYQVMIVPLWLAPFIGILRGMDPLLLSAYVLIGPAFSAWFGLGQVHGVYGVLIGWTSYALVGLAWLLARSGNFRSLDLRPVWTAVWPVAWPLMLFAVSAGIARSFDAWLIAHMADERAFAVFRYGAREFPWVTALAAGFSTSMIPLLAAGGDPAALRARTTRLMHASLPVVAIAMVASPLLFPRVFGQAYAESALIFNIYLLLGLTQVVFPQTVLTARGETRLLWRVSLVELGINIAASIPLYLMFGLPGVAWGTVIAFAAEKLILLVILQRKFGLPADRIVPLRAWALYAAGLIMIFMLSGWLR